jgi:hypothetical protein
MRSFLSAGNAAEIYEASELPFASAESGFAATLANSINMDAISLMLTTRPTKKLTAGKALSNFGTDARATFSGRSICASL